MILSSRHMDVPEKKQNFVNQWWRPCHGRGPLSLYLKKYMKQWTRSCQDVHRVGSRNSQYTCCVRSRRQRGPSTRLMSFHHKDHPTGPHPITMTTWVLELSTRFFLISWVWVQGCMVLIFNSRTEIVLMKLESKTWVCSSYGTTLFDAIGFCLFIINR